MKFFNLGLLIIITFFLFQCDIPATNLNTNEIALELVKLEKEGKIQQSDRRDAFILFFEDTLINNFISDGYGHRIKEIKENWKIYEDKEFIIFIGSIAKTDNEIYVFTLVYENLNEGKYDLIYKQIGEKIVGKYPNKILPN